MFGGAAFTSARGTDDAKSDEGERRSYDYHHDAELTQAEILPADAPQVRVA
jgi:hypothetical protein